MEILVVLRDILIYELCIFCYVLAMPEFYWEGGPDEPVEGQIRLIVGTQRSHSEGNVQYFHDGKWGSICDDEWDKSEADVVCRELGFNDQPGSNVPTKRSKYGPSLDTFWIDETYCLGKEKRLSECQFSSIGDKECAKSEAAGVICDTFSRNEEPRFQPKPIYSSAKEGLHLRLVGGPTIREGRIEVEHENGKWYYICGDGWGLPEANVVCRQMSLGHAHRALQVRLVGNNIADFVLFGVECKGTESRLEECLHQSYGLNNGLCPGLYSNLAGIECSIDLPDLILNIGVLQSSLFIQNQLMTDLQCAQEENCLSSSAYSSHQNYGFLHRQRTLLRFTAAILNNGTADFRPFLAKLDWIWHLCHRHYHSMEIFAHYDLLDPITGRKAAEGHKASFCLEDNECNFGHQKQYRCENNGDQGISVGCTDVYTWDIDCQWIDITDISSGTYIFRVEINSEFKVAELSFDNNSASCRIHIDKSGATITILDPCRLNK